MTSFGVRHRGNASNGRAGAATGANFGIGVQMDGNTDSSNPSRGTAKPLDGYTVHLLSLDGTITTVRKKPAADDATVELTVEIRDRKAEREVPAELAQNVRSPEFTRGVREVKAELLDRQHRRGRRRSR